jgi:Type II secretion system (T2SS), protein E, N-terminal domain
MQGARYCRVECLELALVELLDQAAPVSRRAATVSHRIPLGLLLLSRQQLTAAQLRTALEAQRAAARGKSRKIGAWLQELGFVTEHQVTAALASQWSCPVLRSGPGVLATTRCSLIPALLLESFQMMPVELVESTGTLLIAFSEGIDHTVLYAIERMLGYRTEACLVCPSTLQRSLQSQVRQGVSRDVVFERVEGISECARIIGNYSAKVKAEEVRLARCGEHLWIRLERMRHEAVNLVLRVPVTDSQFSVAALAV